MTLNFTNSLTPKSTVPVDARDDPFAIAFFFALTTFVAGYP